MNKDWDEKKTFMSKAPSAAEAKRWNTFKELTYNVRVELLKKATKLFQRKRLHVSKC